MIQWAKDKGTLDDSGKLYKIAIGILHGKLNQLTDKQIVIENQSKQMIFLLRSCRTRFLRKIVVEVTEDKKELGGFERQR